MKHAKLCSDLLQGTFDSSKISEDGTFISASVVPCGGKGVGVGGRWGRERERETLRGEVDGGGWRRLERSQSRKGF